MLYQKKKSWIQSWSTFCVFSTHYFGIGRISKQAFEQETSKIWVPNIETLETKYASIYTLKHLENLK